MKTNNPYEKYRKEKNCDYPFKPDKYGYCWGWATVSDEDGEIKKTFEARICKGCEYFNGKNKEVILSYPNSGSHKGELQCPYCQKTFFIK